MLDGQSAEIALQHFCVMSASDQSLKLQVIPDSGTAVLTRLKSELSICIDEGVHYYDFEYSLRLNS